jgi:hypothetical protein
MVLEWFSIGYLEDKEASNEKKGIIKPVQEKRKKLF